MGGAGAAALRLPLPPRPLLRLPPPLPLPGPSPRPLRLSLMPPLPTTASHPRPRSSRLPLRRLLHRARRWCRIRSAQVTATSASRVTAPCSTSASPIRSVAGPCTRTGVRLALFSTRARCHAPGPTWCPVARTTPHLNKIKGTNTRNTVTRSLPKITIDVVFYHNLSVHPSSKQTNTFSVSATRYAPCSACHSDKTLF